METCTSSASSFHPVAPFTVDVFHYTGVDDDGVASASSSSSSSAATPRPRPPAPPAPPLESLLPGVYRDEGNLPHLDVPSLTAAYLTAELGLGRLDGDFGHHWFWLLGSPALPRPLHDCAHRGRAICVTERMDRHLGLGLGPGPNGGGNKRNLLYVKPLPRLLLDVRFWEDVLASRTCGKRHLWACALGFLYSYAALVAHESDFRLAQQHGLLPPEVGWPAWRALTRQVVASPDVAARGFHPRFLYGELRLNRLREISQLKRGGLLPVLAGRLDRFARFFQNNVRWLASLVAYIAIVLSALQTGLTTDRLADNGAFQRFASGFTVFALLGPLAILLAFALYFGLSLVYHIGVHLVTNHLFAATAAGPDGVLEGIDGLHHWESKSEV
ncbi:hypothetical protein SPI_00931 [Niveomyces insectorum RCEF 264]|uniref:Subtilisin-like serine protease n=1 Tax=Niveomyces insectorum RCEF 264 TaxID=1081102 RepID=A0A168AH48_9HYPO|nr:hypothetical protein SPI_00931 [Niveomyces insectorum RCEF 264]